VDYGGGTLDISNCNIHKNSGGAYEVEVVTQRGTSIDERGRYSDSYAGVGFDRHVVSHFPEIPPKNMASYLTHFETLYKINRSNLINKELKDYYAAGTNKKSPWKPDMNGEPYIITPQMLDDSFRTVNLPKLREYFNTVVPQENRSEGGAALQDNFRILLIGGFSQLYCVEHYIRDFLGIDPASLHDRRLADVNVNERFLAVAFGAAIEANRNRTGSGRIGSYGIGVKSFNGSEITNEVITAENSKFVKDEILWCQKTFGIISGKKALIHLYCSTSVSGEGEPYPVDISGTFNDNSRVMLGISLENGVCRLHVKNIENDQKVDIDITNLTESYRKRGGGNYA